MWVTACNQPTAFSVSQQAESHRGIGAARPITEELGLRPGAGLSGGGGGGRGGGAGVEQRRAESLQLTRARFEALDNGD
jgi:hypothetical protein